MNYKAIGIMSGSSLDGLDIVFAAINENAGKWSYEILHADCYVYSDEWINKLKNATGLAAREYLLLHAEYGHYLGGEVNRFIHEKGLEYQVGVIGSHGHTTFHMPAQKMTAQLGDGAAIAAVTGLRVVSDLRALDIAFGGQGAPVVPIGERLLLPGYDAYLNIGGIANISLFAGQEGQLQRIAFDICPANRVLNMLAAEAGKEMDEGGGMAAFGKVYDGLLKELNGLDYYKKNYPKSLANDFGTDIIYPVIKKYDLSIEDALRTYTDHIAACVGEAVKRYATKKRGEEKQKLLVTGGGAFNIFLIERISNALDELGMEVIVPEANLVKYKEALIMALMGVLRWREEDTVLASVTGAARNSIGGAMWMGQEM